MHRTASTANVPALGMHEREDVGNQLQATLVELIDLSLFGKQLHWSVVGRDFRSLHIQLDELIDVWRDLGDTVAERSVALGHFPDGQAHAVAASSEIPPEQPGPIEDVTVVRVLTHRLADTAERVRERMGRVGEVDAVSQDVLIDVTRALEEQLWMVRAQHVQGGS
jgi:starvation-inducible DNA-binding protein